MRRFVTWLGCLLGALWIFKRFRRGTPPELAADPAEELRRKLDESRGGELEDESVGARLQSGSDSVSEAPAVEPKAPEAGLEERRRAVHDRGRAAIDAMRGRPDESLDS